MSFVIIIAYINGSGAGAASGVAMGIIVGMSSENMIMFIGMYGICGLITGVFKETGKVFKCNILFGSLFNNKDILHYRSGVYNI